MSKKNPKILVLPDIHGRTFWKKPCETPEKYDKIIFLGDYVDPYPDEGIDRDETIENFKEILAFKKKHPKKCILLIGNHDMSYVNNMMPKSRHDYQNHSILENLFIKNIKHFDVLYEINIGDIRYIFSHSGIEMDWVDNFKELYEWDEPNDDNFVDFINNLFHTSSDYAASILYMVSRYRGGWDRYGSCVWGDLNEFYTYIKSYNTHKILNSYQIFGHTMIKRPLVTKEFACLDYSIPVVFQSGKFYMPSGDEIPITVPK